jgi:hypothetical protein
MQEPVEVRLSRIENGLVALHDKIDYRHDMLEKNLIPLSNKVEEHGMSLAILKRDRWWIFSLVGAVFSAIIYTYHSH